MGQAVVGRDVRVAGVRGAAAAAQRGKAAYAEIRNRIDEDRAMCGRSRPPKQTARMGQRSGKRKKEDDR